jgi:hypothetical protein
MRGAAGAAVAATVGSPIEVTLGDENLELYGAS